MKRAYYLLGVATLALPSNAAALPEAPPEGYYDVVASNPAGTVDNITYGSNYVARVYTPPGYSESQQYPAMYLMHGMGGSERSWHDNDLYAHIQLDNLLAEGVVAPFVIVFTRNDYANWSGFGDILINELIPYVEENYSVCSDPENRALGGLSMGGMQTINFGFPNTDTFHYLMSSSPAPGIQGEGQLFPDDGAAAQANLNLIFFSCGSEEVGSYGCNNVNTVRGYGESNGLGDIIEEIIIQGGAHNAATWRPSFWNYAQLAHQAGFTNLAASCGGSTGGSGGVGGQGGTGGMDAGTGGSDTFGGTGGTGAGGASVAGGSAGTETAGGSAGTETAGGSAGVGPAGGTAGISSGGTGAAATGGEDGADVGPGDASVDAAGCSCTTTPSRTSTSGAWLSLLLGMLTVGIRRRRERP